LNLSTKPAIYVSHIDISDVNPAKTREAKNKNPNNSLRTGNSLIIAGNTTKASPTPSATTSSTATPDRTAIKPRQEKTPIPDNKSQLELPKPVIMHYSLYRIFSVSNLST